MGDTYNTTVDVGEWGTVSLAPGATQTRWFTWGFDSNHWIYFDACPDSTDSEIWVISQGATKDLNGGVTRWATFKNAKNQWAAFRPRCVIAPRR
jgi:hypothetical protein